MRIVVLDGYTLNPGDNPWDPVEALGDLAVFDRTEDALIVDRARHAEIVLTNKTRLTAHTLEQLPRLQFISVLATGFNVVDVDAARERAIPVANVPEYGTDSVAQYVMAVILHFARQCARHSELVKQGEWTGSVDFCFWETPLNELTGKRLGIIGFGRIGRAVGKLANGFGMEVLAHDTNPRDTPAYEPFAWAGIEEIFSQCDYVSLHCPETATNQGMVNRALLEKMRPNSVFINTARGGLVNESDLAAVLEQERIAGAAIDVLSAEPPPADHPLLRARKCLITPHIAWATLAARQRLMSITADNVRAFLAGTPINIVNSPEM